MAGTAGDGSRRNGDGGGDSIIVFHASYIFSRSRHNISLPWSFLLHYLNNVFFLAEWLKCFDLQCLQDNRDKNLSESLAAAIFILLNVLAGCSSPVASFFSLFFYLLTRYLMRFLSLWSGRNVLAVMNCVLSFPGMFLFSPSPFLFEFFSLSSPLWCISRADKLPPCHLSIRSSYWCSSPTTFTQSSVILCHN